jgi:hypothetical protein
VVVQAGYRELLVKVVKQIQEQASDADDTPLAPILPVAHLSESSNISFASTLSDRATPPVVTRVPAQPIPFPAHQPTPDNVSNGGKRTMSKARSFSRSNGADGEMQTEELLNKFTTLPGVKVQPHRRVHSMSGPIVADERIGGDVEEIMPKPLFPVKRVHDEDEDGRSRRRAKVDQV